MIIDAKNPKHIIAEDGKVLYRRNDNAGPFKEVLLGMYNYGGIMQYETEKDFYEAEI